MRRGPEALPPSQSIYPAALVVLASGVLLGDLRQGLHCPRISQPRQRRDTVGRAGLDVDGGIHHQAGHAWLAQAARRAEPPPEPPPHRRIFRTPDAAAPWRRRMDHTCTSNAARSAIVHRLLTPRTKGGAATQKGCLISSFQPHRTMAHTILFSPFGSPPTGPSIFWLIEGNFGETPSALSPAHFPFWRIAR